jgi:hypothetical protein|tara:strand:- start:1126 stop:1461 length:336 start_codon:yes stop_codon:yes gene_type:complete
MAFYFLSDSFFSNLFVGGMLRVGTTMTRTLKEFPKEDWNGGLKVMKREFFHPSLTNEGLPTLSSHSSPARRWFCISREAKAYPKSDFTEAFRISVPSGRRCQITALQGGYV